MSAYILTYTYLQIHAYLSTYIHTNQHAYGHSSLAWYMHTCQPTNIHTFRIVKCWKTWPIRPEKDNKSVFMLYILSNFRIIFRISLYPRFSYI